MGVLNYCKLKICCPDRYHTGLIRYDCLIWYMSVTHDTSTEHLMNTYRESFVMNQYDESIS